MTRVILSVLALSALGLAACSEKTEPAQAAPATSAPKSVTSAPKATAPKVDSAATLAAERAKLAGMTTPFASLAEWTAACETSGLDAKICTCAGENTVKTLGEKGLYTWVYEGYVNRDGSARMRSGKFFTAAGLDTAAKQKFADAVGACYTF
jgi:hypothetical protein